MVRIIETFCSRQQDSNSHLVIDLPPWCRQPYLISCMEWAPQEQRMQKLISCASLKNMKWWLKFSGIIIILSKWCGHSFNNPQLNPSPLNCYEINSRVKNVFEGFEALQALVTQAAALQSSADLAWQICFYLVKSKEVYLVLLFCSQA